MTTINPNLVPTINPGSIFDAFTTDTTLNIRWLGPTDPVFYGSLNRPLADIALRQLIIAKALDNLSTSIGFMAIFPFVISPYVSNGTSVIDLPIRLFWDFNSSIPVKWANLRLARIDRLTGSNDPGTGVNFTGTLRFIFTANDSSGGSLSPVETALFFVDYEIDSILTYQRIRVQPAEAADVPGFTPIDAGERITIDGEVIFRTLDLTSTTNHAFLDFVSPGTNAYYPITDSNGTISNPDFDLNAISHGTGILTSTAFTYITPINSDPITWLTAFNYPFDEDATRTSNDSTATTIPAAMFRECDIVAPAGDQGTDDITSLNFPIWINKIDRDGTKATPTITFYFSTHVITPVGSSTPVEFGTLTLDNNMNAGEVVEIVPFNSLFTDKSGAGWFQDFGRGHVVLSNKWGVTGGEISDFFSAFPLIPMGVTTVTFGNSATRISSFGISRVPKYTPTAGQAAALYGTSSDRATPLYPDAGNKFVTELDEGLGDTIDLDSETGITAHPAIDKYGYTGGRAHKIVKLVMDPEAASASADPNFYANQILPRLTILLGRSPIFGDTVYSGSRFLIFNGDAFIG